MAYEMWFRSNGAWESRFLSNFWPCTVTVDGLMGESAEHVYQAMKCPEHAQFQVLSQNSAYDAMREGRRLGRPHRDASTVMRRIIHAKFTQNAALKQQLIATGDAVLIEDNRGPWGGRDGGENRLGHLLMELRAELKGS